MINSDTLILNEVNVFNADNLYLLQNSRGFPLQVQEREKFVKVWQSLISIP